MIITCEQCNTAFNLDESVLKPSGSKVRCSKCRYIFTAFPPGRPRQAPPSEAPAVEQPPDLSAAAAVGGTATPSIEDELDLSDLKSELESDEEPVEGEEDLNIGLDLGEEESKPQPAVEDELDLSDLDFGDEEKPGQEAASTPSSDEGEFDFSDLDLDAGDEPPVETPTAAGDEGELELGDLELDLGGGEEEAPAVSGKAAGAEDELDFGDLELDLGGGEEEAPAAAGGAAGAEDELDLGGLELDLGGGEEEAPAVSGKAAGAEDEVDFGDLDLDLGGGEEEAPAAAGGAAGAEGELDLGDLDLDLGDAGKKSPPAASDKQGPAEDELDISELESALDEDDEDFGTDEELEDLDLDFELEPVDEGEPADVGGVELEAGDKEIDLSELETMLGDEEVDAEMPSQQFDLDMDLDMEAAPGSSEEMELDLETGDLDLGAEDGKIEEIEEIEEIDDIEEIDELDIEEIDAEESTQGGATFAETIDMETLEREAEALEGDQQAALPLDKKARKKAEKEAKKRAKQEAKEARKARKKRPKAKSKLGKPVLVLLLLAILAGGGYYAVVYMGIEIPRIPYVSDFISPAPDNVNRIEVMQATVRSKFVENQKTGKLFIITGRVRNGHRDARNFISVTGNLFAKKKKVQSKTVFAGNVLTGVQLSSMDMNQITKALRNRLGDKKSNMNVSPNHTLPFMIVFDNLPAELEEFTVEPGTSTAAQ
ncbi:MAG: DUF3426 domain-containing protein [Desulfobacterales bacterium]|jgi:predicted Zn finger-like uncharacterized protein